MPVVTATVAQRDVPVEIQAIGNVEAFETVSIRSQVTGTVTEVLFREGDFVKKGDHLFTIDRRPYEAQLDQAKANLSRDEALLAQAKAQLTRDKAQGDYLQLTSQRNNELVERGIISKDFAQQSQAAARFDAKQFVTTFWTERLLPATDQVADVASVVETSCRLVRL